MWVTPIGAGVAGTAASVPVELGSLKLLPQFHIHNPNPHVMRRVVRSFMVKLLF
jgi:hypothetical protein